MSGQGSRYPSIWDGAPFAIVTGLLLLLAIINWDYADKLLLPLPGDDLADRYLGPILLLIGWAFALASCFFFYLFRRNHANAEWLSVVLNGFFCLLLLLMSFFFVILGPAAITMKEQMTTVPEANPQPAR